MHRTWRTNGERLALLIAVVVLAGCDGETEPGDSCSGDEPATCSEDGQVLGTCEGGAWVETDCMATAGQLCEDGGCVDPWRYGDPAWSTCDGLADGTAESLADKAAYYDDIARRLHVHPELRWASDVYLHKQEVSCSGGQSPPCYEPVTPEDQATWNDVETWRSGENDGLWSGLYLASQAYRYAVTGSDEALMAIYLLLTGEADRMAITGIDGLFTRQLIPPGVAGIACPDDPASYAVDDDKDDNRWVRIGDDGCAWVTVTDDHEWAPTTHCGLDAYAGWCFLDNVSQDEYVGHMFALGALARLVDDVAVQQTVSEMLGAIGEHLVDNELTFVDWDGRYTEHGRLYPMALTDTPGYLAVMAMSFMAVAAEGSGRDDLRQYYEQCLLQVDGPHECWTWPGQEPQPFTDYLPALLLYMGEGSCESNWNNFSMAMANFHHLLWYERDADVRTLLQDALATEVMFADQDRALIEQHNPWYDVMWAAHKALGPTSDGPDYQAVEDAVCALRRFPASEARRGVDATALYDHDCTGRLDNSLADEPIPPYDQCMDTFLYWSNPYQRDVCSEQPWLVFQPGEYLLAYWMARYYGFVDESI